MSKSSEILALLSQCLNCREPYEIKCLNNECEIRQMVSGTRGATYVYVYDNGFFVNIKRLPQVKLISIERSGRRTEEIYRVSKELLKNKLILTFSFGRESGYSSIHLCVGEQEAVRCCSCEALERDDELALKIASMFRPLGGEEDLIKWYLHIVPRMSKEILSIVTKSGAKGIFVSGHAERLREALYSPGLSVLMTMALTTAQGRAKSLAIKISYILELFVIAKIVDALEGTSLTESWTIEFTTNTPLAVVRSRATGKEYTILYQSSILPHILPGFVKDVPKRLIPDIAVFEGRIEGVGWGELYKLAEQGVVPKLLVEVKTGLGHLRWEKPDYVVEQVREYKRLLKPKNVALVSLKNVDPMLKAQLKTLGVTIFENFADETVQAEFKRYVVKALMM